jgi:monoamine oxidase
VLKTGVSLSATGLLNGCRKAADLFPEEPAGQTLQLKASQPRIVILGAGMAGLNCAYQLKKSGLKAAVYEASNRTGGRIYSQKNVLDAGLITELGGEFIDTEHKDMLKLCHEFGAPLDTLSKADRLCYGTLFLLTAAFIRKPK